MIILNIIIIGSFFVSTLQISPRSSLFYVAGVVEYSPERNGPNPGKINLNNYIDIIVSEEAKETDIIVFPEATLSSVTHSLPDPESKIVPCDDETSSDVIREISCAARSTKKYILINVLERSECSEESIKSNDTKLCSSKGYNQYNSNVVFDRSGTIISRYRKFNLFGELNTDITLIPDISIFETDFGVTFGHFICFDLLFDEPTRILLEKNVTNILYPSLWFSEIPFLTAVQIQLYWSFRYNVNLLAAGGNTPSIGSTGSGIYNGKNGQLVGGMNFEDTTKLYVARVPKIHGYEGSIHLGHSAMIGNSELKNVSQLKLLRDYLNHYNSKLLDFNKNILSEEICYYDMCCTAKINWTHKSVLQTQDFYRYRFGIFNGVRSFSGFATGGVIACALYACTDETVENCGVLFEDTREVVHDAVTFNSIEIEGNFDGGSHIMLLPNALLNTIMPLPVHAFKYIESDDYVSDKGETLRHVNMNLEAPRSDLLTFGIWGKNYKKDGDIVSSEYYDTGHGDHASVYWELTVVLLVLNVLGIF